MFGIINLGRPAHSFPMHTRFGELYFFYGIVCSADFIIDIRSILDFLMVSFPFSTGTGILHRDYIYARCILLKVPDYSFYIPHQNGSMSYNTCQLILVMLEIGITPDFSITLAPMAHTYQTPKYQQFSCMHFRLHTDCRNETFYYMRPRFPVTL